PKQDSPLLLWGLTLGVISDFLDLIPPHNALELWTYPTFSPLDVRFVVWLMTYRFKQRKRAELQAGTAVPSSSTSSSSTGTNTATPTKEAGPARMNLHRPSFGGVTESLANSAVLVPRPDETGLHGLGTGSAPPHPADIPPNSTNTSSNNEKNGDPTPDPRKAAVSTMLEGYYDIVRRAVGVALLGRAATALVIVLWVLRRRRGRRGTVGGR
ncbi:hypothetical protein KC342_g6472, partial [Hortaea werneckii]